MNDRPTVGSLFSGIGGLDLGLHRAGCSPLWFCESDSFCRAVLERHWPGVPCFRDVRDVGPGAPRPDVLAGGFPCQPVSNAGRRRGRDDERWMWPEMARAVRDLRPRIVVVENVPGLFVRGMGDVLGDLAALGFDAEWCSVSAFDAGAPHLRERVFIVAYTERAGLEGSLGEIVEAARDRRQDSDPSGSTRGVGRGEWESEPAVDRVAYGIPRRVDRLRALGNAVVPAVGELVGRRVMEVLGD